MEGRWTVAAALMSLALVLAAAGLFFSPGVSALPAPKAALKGREGPSSPLSAEGEGAPARGGTLRLLLPDGQVETLALEDYVEGVLRAEMPASFAPAALEAQGVCARTYALRRRGNGPHSPGADVCTDPGCCQGFLPEAPEGWGEDGEAYSAKLHAAAAATAGQVLTRDGQLIDAVFHASSSGFTAPAQAVWGAAVPYLVSVPTPETAGTVEDLFQEVSFTPGELEALLGSGEVGPAVYADWGGVEALSVGGKAMPGTEVRRRLGLRSARFTVERRADRVVFTTVGYGHGVGMSQRGADLMAKAGAGFEEILAHYYPGTALTAIKEEDSGF